MLPVTESPSLRVFLLARPGPLRLGRASQREQTRCDNRVLLFIQELSPLARWPARLMSPYSLSAEASSRLDVHTGVTAQSGPCAGDVPPREPRKCVWAGGRPPLSSHTALRRVRAPVKARCCCFLSKRNRKAVTLIADTLVSVAL